MQSASSRDSNNTGSSAETLPQVKVKCPVVLSSPPPLSSPPVDTDAAPLPALCDELLSLGATSEQRVGYLHQQLDKLQGWIREAFATEDVQQWAEQVFLTKSGQTEAAVNLISPRVEEEVKPVLPLRIKLVDDKSKPITPSAPRSGTGSKNLSRMMSRPSEATAETKAKAAVNQTPITVFWNYIEPFFKPVEENDLRVLDDTSKFIDPAPFTIPPLGRHYEEHWRETYGYTVHGRSTRRRPMQNGTDAEANSPPRVASLRERLLAMLIEENLTVPETSENGGGGDSTPPDEISQEQSTSPSPLETLKGINFVHVDERIRQELSQSGLCSFVPKVDYQEDDEICAEMRTLQRRLRDQVCLNHYRKRKLAELVRTKLPSQEFYTLLSEIDKQIEQAYSKRSKVQKQQKKKKPSVTTLSPSPVSAQMEPVPLVETRQKLLAAFSDIIPSQREFLASSAPAALFNAADEAKVLQYAHESGNWLPIPEQSLQHVKLAKQPAHPVFPALERQKQSERERQPSTVSEQEQPEREGQPSTVAERERQSSTVFERERQSSIVFETPTLL